MKEKLKTLVLGLLVGLSIFLTKQIWIGLPPNRALSSVESVTDSSSLSYPLINMITPSKYLIHFNDKKHTILYDDVNNGLWAATIPNLERILESKDVKITGLENNISEELSKLSMERSIFFSFPEQINTSILARSLEVTKPNGLVDKIEYIDYVYVYLGTDEDFMILGEKDKAYIIKDKSIDNLELKQEILRIEEEKKHNYYYSMKDVIGIDKDLYVAYEMNNNLAKVYVENEIRTLKERDRIDLVERFFNKNIEYIREVVERNGSYIYIYDGSVLKLNINGTMEYFRPLDNMVQKRNLYESMDTASEFISNLKDIPKGMYISELDTIEENGSQGYRFVFKYRIRGIPIILGNKKVLNFVEIEVFNDQVRSYKQFIRKDMGAKMPLVNENRTMLSSFDIIDMNYEFIILKYLELNKDGNLDVKLITREDIISSIDDITLAYFDPSLKDVEDELVGVWAIGMGKNLYCFDVYTGELVYEKEL